ncbi:hypothetical protein DSL72_008415 [Monilinia vaccinii-corymbosi]|uniref:Calpain catalytic domain-containing protein n=1 Tax=Monilinia vaccinii-corymbosi TaxID=61207 RepID=A0A8A3PKM0_9HELO|nr:hypothetical protein DSL72_008415 [Monilinia vaccinii-corymbosi]
MAVVTSTSSAQESLDTFWKNKLTPEDVITRPPQVLPKHIYERLVREHQPPSPISGCSVGISYDAAVKECEAKVAAIVTECRRNNTKYTDDDFDLDDKDYCLKPLTATGPLASDGRGYAGREFSKKAADIARTVITRTGTLTKVREPACAKRVGDIFEHPQFFIDHVAHVQDIRQGAEGDCWFISSLGCLAVDDVFPRLINKLCPRGARDEKIGVYGFVFYRDGAWVSEVIDDKLYLTNPDYDDCDDERRSVWDRSHGRLDPEASRAEYRKASQTGSDALFFASCADPNETWVPLIEKAFAKVHGDYDAINGGWPGEGVEDLTGGVTASFFSADILDTDNFWTQGLMKVGRDFIFSAGTKEYHHPDPDQLGRQGVEDDHAYSILRAVEYQGNRLCLIKNPWGETEWNGPWSDGSKEWTKEALEALHHRFGNEGIFWMSYEDFLRRYDEIWRTRLFHCDWLNWNVAQHWTTVNVPWSGAYNETSFHFTLPAPTTAVIVLSQLDTRYFGGLTGQYTYSLSFHLHPAGQKPHLVRGYPSGDRSATTELFLDAGTYDVFLHIAGYRDEARPKIEHVVQRNWLARRDKLVQIGWRHDVARAKGKIHDASPSKGGSVPRSNPNPAPSGAARDAFTPPATPPMAHATLPHMRDATGAAEAPWDASCVVGLKIYTFQTLATIKVGAGADADAGEVEMEAQAQAGADASGEGLRAIRKLISHVDDSFSSSLRKVKVKTRRKSLRIKWKFNGEGLGLGLDEEAALGLGLNDAVGGTATKTGKREKKERKRERKREKRDRKTQRKREKKERRRKRE